MQVWKMVINSALLSFWSPYFLVFQVQYDDITKQLDDMAQAEGIEQTNIKYGDNKVTKF